VASVRIHVKKQIQLGRLSFSQQQMVKLGTVGVAAVKNRLATATGPEDAPAKPLSKGYAIRKNRMLSRGGFRRTGVGSGRKGVRDLMLTGNMLRNLTVRTVTEKAAKASLTSRKERIKGWANMKRELWLVFSPKNRQAVVEAARRLFQENAKRLTFTKMIGVRG